jgi:hypothetical protein
MAQKTEFAIVKTRAESQAPSVSVERYHGHEYNIDESRVDASLELSARLRNLKSIAPHAVAYTEFDELHAASSHVDYAWRV